MITEREMRLLGAFHWGCICGDGVSIVSRVVGTTDNDNNLEERRRIFIHTTTHSHEHIHILVVYNGNYID